MVSLSTYSDHIQAFNKCYVISEIGWRPLVLTFYKQKNKKEHFFKGNNIL